MHYALFIVGGRGSGKSTLIRALTGFGRKRPWRVKSLSGKDIYALIIHQSPQELGMKKYPPEDFPDIFEKEYGVAREKYSLLISALEIYVRDPHYSYMEYINQTLKKGFKVGMAIIDKRWNGTIENKKRIRDAQNFAVSKGIPYILVDATLDPNVVANKIRSKLYPP